MAESDESGLLETFDDSISEEDIESAEEKAEELTERDFKYVRGVYDRDPGEAEDRARERYRAAAYERTLAARERARKRRDAGLEDKGLFEYAQRLYQIGEGTRKTAGQIEAERQLKVFGQAQKGMAQAYGGFDAAALLERGSRGAQRTELTGETQIGEAARQASLAAKSQLEQLLIQSRERARDKAFRMQQLAFQEEQASGALWSNVLSGILGAVGAVVGAFTPAGPIAGAAAGSALGTGVGRWVS